MDPVFHIPTVGIPVKDHGLQTQLRQQIAQNQCDFLVDYDDELVLVISSRSRAKELLQLDNIHDVDARSVRSVISKLVLRNRSSSLQVLSGSASRFKEYISHCKDGDSFCTGFIDPEAILLIESLYGIRDSSLVDIHRATLRSDEAAANKAVEKFAKGDSDLNMALAPLGEKNIRAGFLLAYAVSVQPIANFIGLALFERTKLQGANSDIALGDLWRLLVSRVGPTFPGIFREIADGDAVLIPTTWPECEENFTFGYGARSCPGRSLVYSFFSSLMDVIDSEFISLLEFVPRPHLPFGFSDIIYKGNNGVR